VFDYIADSDRPMFFAAVLGSSLKFSLIQVVKYLALQLELTYWKDHE
jgi:hypothetical protein